MKKKNILIGCSIICILLLSFAFFKIFANNNINQDEETSSKTAVSEKQQLYEIITNPDLTSEEKAEKAEELLYAGNTPTNPPPPADKSKFGGVNTGVIDSTLAPENEMVKDIILNPNFTNDQKIEALNRLLYIGKETK